jgi:tryptophan synthase beta subunit
MRSAESSADASDSARGYDIVCLSGRGDKDLAEALRGLEELQ